MDGVVIDNPGRVVLPATVAVLPDEMPVYAASLADLAARPEAWIGRLGRENLWITDLFGPSDNALREQIAQRLAIKFEMQPVPHLLSGRGTVIRVSRR